MSRRPCRASVRLRMSVWWWECRCGRLGYGDHWARVLEAAHQHVAARRNW